MNNVTEVNEIFLYLINVHQQEQEALLRPLSEDVKVAPTCCPLCLQLDERVHYEYYNGTLFVKRKTNSKSFFILKPK